MAVVRFDETFFVEIDLGTFAELFLVLLSPISFREYISIDSTHYGEELTNRRPVFQ